MKHLLAAPQPAPSQSQSHNADVEFTKPRELSPLQILARAFPVVTLDLRY